MQVRFNFANSHATIEALEGQARPNDAFAYQMLAYEAVALKLETLLLRLNTQQDLPLSPEERIILMQSGVVSVIEELREQALYLHP